MIFIKKSKTVVKEKEAAVEVDRFNVEEIVTEEMKKEICEVLGAEFDLYLHGLRYRDFAAVTNAPI